MTGEERQAPTARAGPLHNIPHMMVRCLLPVNIDFPKMLCCLIGGGMKCKKLLLSQEFITAKLPL